VDGSSRQLLAPGRSAIRSGFGIETALKVGCDAVALALSTNNMIPTLTVGVQSEQIRSLRAGIYSLFQFHLDVSLSSRCSEPSTMDGSTSVLNPSKSWAPFDSTAFNKRSEVEESCFLWYRQQFPPRLGFVRPGPVADEMACCRSGWGRRWRKNYQNMNCTYVAP
jgi:hypothetical protein